MLTFINRAGAAGITCTSTGPSAARIVFSAAHQQSCTVVAASPVTELGVHVMEVVMPVKVGG